MKRIVEHLYIGTVTDVQFAQQSGMSILGAAKEPFHRQHAKLQGANEEGYVGKAMPKDEPEYLFAERDHALYLNLIDARDVKYIPDEVINKALDFIDKEIADGRDVLIACNKGESRSPSIILMWFIKQGTFDYVKDFDYEQNGLAFIFDYFMKNIYPNYKPSVGMVGYITKFWEDYKHGK